MLSASSLLLITIIGILHGVHSSHDWGYDTFDWPGVCASGKAQSPIDLDVSVGSPREYSPFIFKNYSLQYTASVKNNGHAIAVSFQGSTSRIYGGALPEEYTLDHFHFHWGGSEHTVNGRRYPLEMHLVHYATRLKSVANAVKFKDGLAVLGVLFDVSPDDDEDFAALEEVMMPILSKLDAAGTTKKLRPDSFLPRDTAGFFRYHGSLTTPGCDEVVIWTVFTNTVPISKRQLEHFTEFKNKNGRLPHNYRPVQPLNNRMLYYKESPVGSLTKHSGQSQVTVSLTAFIASLFLFFR